jgi:hypothetical protein
MFLRLPASAGADSTHVRLTARRNQLLVCAIRSLDVLTAAWGCGCGCRQPAEQSTHTDMHTCTYNARGGKQGNQVIANKLHCGVLFCSSPTYPSISRTHHPTTASLQTHITHAPRHSPSSVLGLARCARCSRRSPSQLATPSAPRTSSDTCALATSTAINPPRLSTSKSCQAAMIECLSLGGKLQKVSRRAGLKAIVTHYGHRIGRNASQKVDYRGIACANNRLDSS